MAWNTSRLTTGITKIKRKTSSMLNFRIYGIWSPTVPFFLFFFFPLIVETPTYRNIDGCSFRHPDPRQHETKITYEQDYLEGPLQSTNTDSHSSQQPLYSNTLYAIYDTPITSQRFVDGAQSFGTHICHF